MVINDARSSTPQNSSVAIQVRQTTYAWHNWKSKDKSISDVLLWTPIHGHTRVGWPGKTYIHQHSAEMECWLEDLTRVMTDRDRWRERDRESRESVLSARFFDNHHHHHVALVAQISLTFSRHSSLSFIALGRSSGQHPVSSHSCWMYVRAGRPDFARPCVGVHKSTSLMSLSLLLQQCPACLVRLTWIVFVMGGTWLYSWCLVGCCRQDLFKIARSILV